MNISASETNLKFGLPTLDYLWSSFILHQRFCLLVVLGPISEVRTHKQASRQLMFARLLLYEKENILMVPTALVYEREFSA